MASLEEISTRPGLDRAATAILHALEAASELAYIVREQADNPHLTGPARALSIRAHNDAETGLLSPHHTAGDIVWVSPADILARRHIALPPPVAEALRSAGDAATQAAATAAAAAVGLTSTRERAYAGPPAATSDVDRTPKIVEETQAHRSLPAHRARATQP